MYLCSDSRAYQDKDAPTITVQLYIIITLIDKTKEELLRAVKVSKLLMARGYTSSYLQILNKVTTTAQNIISF